MTVLFGETDRHNKAEVVSITVNSEAFPKYATGSVSRPKITINFPLSKEERLWLLKIIDENTELEGEAKDDTEV